MTDAERMVYASTFSQVMAGLAGGDPAVRTVEAACAAYLAVLGLRLTQDLKGGEIVDMAHEFCGLTTPVKGNMS